MKRKGRPVCKQKEKKIRLAYELPSEIWCFIFSYIKDLKDVRTIKLCCKSFKEYIEFAFDHSFHGCRALISNCSLGNSVEFSRLLQDKNVSGKFRAMKESQPILYECFGRCGHNEQMFLETARCYDQINVDNDDYIKTDEFVIRRRNISKILFEKVSLSTIKNLINKHGLTNMLCILYDFFDYSFDCKRMDVIQVVIESGIDKSRFYREYDHSDLGERLINKCIRTRYREGLRYLIEKRPQIFEYTENYRDANNYTVKHTSFELACIREPIHNLQPDVEIVRLLLETGYFDPSFPNQDPLRYALEDNCFEIIEFLLSDSRVDPSIDDQLLLSSACEQGKDKIVSLVLNHPKTHTPFAKLLLLATTNNHPKVVEVLLSDPRIDPSLNNHSALRVALEFNYTDIIKLLLPRVKI